MILAIIQARTGSTRLPSKVLADLLGRPMLVRQIERIARVRLIDRAVIATTGQPQDDKIAALAHLLKLDCYRGSVDDVLDRFYQCAKRYDADHILRLTADCPLTDPEVIDQLIRLHLAGEYDYTSNVEPPTDPHGLDAEIRTRDALVQAWNEAVKPSEREHVTSYIRNNAKKFKMGNLRSKEDHSRLRLTVDEPEDLVLIRQIYEALYPANPEFKTRDVLDYLKAHPDLVLINAKFDRLASYEASLERDR